MRYLATYSISFDAESDDEARTIAAQHHQEIRDELSVEGADHPLDIVLQALETDGRHVLDVPREKTIWGTCDE